MSLENDRRGATSDSHHGAARTRPSATAARSRLGASVAGAGCIADDHWTGRDKCLHFLAGAAIGAGALLVVEPPRRAVLLGVASAAAKELLDARGEGSCSLQDFIISAGGAAAGAFGVGWVLARHRRSAVPGRTASFR